MRNFIKLLSIFCLMFCYSSKAQNNHKTDIFYLLDTAKIPIKDRIVDYYIEHPFMVYIINCKCSNKHANILFLRRENAIGQKLTRNDYNTYNYNTLNDLIIKSNLKTAKEFNSLYNLYIIEPEKENYVRYKIMMVDPFERPGTIDIMTVPSPTKQRR